MVILFLSVRDDVCTKDRGTPHTDIEDFASQILYRPPCIFLQYYQVHPRLLPLEVLRDLFGRKGEGGATHNVSSQTLP